MLVVSVAQRLGSERPLLAYCAAPLKQSGAGKGALSPLSCGSQQDDLAGRAIYAGSTRCDRLDHAGVTVRHVRTQMLTGQHVISFGANGTKRKAAECLIHSRLPG